MNERANYLQRPEQAQRAARLRRWAWVLSSVVLGLVALMRNIPRVPLPDGWSTKMLPPLHAGINATAAVVLVAALLAIWAGRVALHKRLIFVAMGLSVMFLLSYVAYHLTTPEVRYAGEWRGIYLLLLITHIILAAVSLPFILLTFISGLTNQFARHRRMAKWVFPVWLYVAVTGPVCYWMLRPYY